MFWLLTGDGDGESAEGSDVRCCDVRGFAPVREDLRHPECLPIQIPAKDPFFR